MKLKYLLLLSCIFLNGYALKAQKNLAQLQNDLDKIITKTNGDTTKYITDISFNSLVVKRLAYYLSGNDDISVFNNYFTTNTVDKTISLGHNYVFPKEALANNKIPSNILTVALKGSFASIFQESKLTDNIGFNIKYTAIGRNAKLNFDTPKKCPLSTRRCAIQTSILAESSKELADFDALHNIPELDPKYVTKKRNAFENELYKKYIESFIKQELENLDYRVVQDHWLSFDLYLPFNSSQFEMANMGGTEVKNRFFYPISLGATYGYFRENPKGINYLLTIGISVKGENIMSILENYSTKNTKDEIATELDLTKYTIDKSDYYYSSNFASISTTLKPRFLIDIKNNTKTPVKLDLFMNAILGKYARTDLGCGILFTLNGKDAKKPINVEPMITFRDIDNQLLPSRSAKQKLTFGINLTLPFDSLIF